MNYKNFEFVSIWAVRIITKVSSISYRYSKLDNLSGSPSGTAVK